MSVADQVLLEGKKKCSASELVHVVFKIFVKFRDNVIHNTNS